MRDAVGQREQTKDRTKRWIADSGMTFHMTRYADVFRDLRPSEDKVNIENGMLRVTGC